MTKEKRQAVKDILDAKVSAAMLETLANVDPKELFAVKTQYVDEILKEMDEIL